ncbi:hypothetical protein VNO77_03626 [Canavalia gladiata]|uniref:Uncharacterized protein n=1 Tax=Canavalia gladiata TaxID=3824 RepID=A0AAN9MX28_CANGL
MLSIPRLRDESTNLYELVNREGLLPLPTWSEATSSPPRLNEDALILRTERDQRVLRDDPTPFLCPALCIYITYSLVLYLDFT